MIDPRVPRNLPGKHPQGITLPVGKPMPRFVGQHPQQQIAKQVTPNVPVAQISRTIPDSNPITVREFVDMIESGNSPPKYEIYGSVSEFRPSLLPGCESLLELILTQFNAGSQMMISPAEIPLTLLHTSAQYNKPYFEALQKRPDSPLTVFVNSSESRGHGLITPLGYSEFNERWNALMQRVEMIYTPAPKLAIPGKVLETPIYTVETAIQHLNAGNTQRRYGVYGIFSEYRKPTDDDDQKKLKFILTDAIGNRLAIHTNNEHYREDAILHELNSFRETPIILYVNSTEGIADYMQLPIGELVFSDKWNSIYNNMRSRSMPILTPKPLVPPPGITSIHNPE